MAAATVKMFAPTGAGGMIETANSGNVFVATDGTVSVNPADVKDLMALGYQFALTTHDWYTTPCAPAAASAAVTVASAALSNGSLTIAAQPDVPRQLQAIVNPGTTAISAGNLALSYTANDGAPQVDNFSLVMVAGAAAGTIKATFQTSKGVEHLASAVVSGVVGGTTPAIQIGTNALLALPVSPRFQDFAVTKETAIAVAATSGLSTGTDETVGTVTASGGLIAPTTAPDGTHALSFGYNYVSPG
jgi:hypothetical protein